MATHVRKGGKGGRRKEGGEEEEEEEGVVVMLGGEEGEEGREGGVLRRKEGGEGEEEEEEGRGVLLLGGVGSTLKVVDGHFALKDEEGKEEGKEGEVPREGGGEEEGSEEGYADMASYEEAGLGGLEGGEGGREGGEDMAVLPLESLPYMKAEEPVAFLVASRSYDISITYDKYYQTPRAWLLGYDEVSLIISTIYFIHSFIRFQLPIYRKDNPYQPLLSSKTSSKTTPIAPSPSRLTLTQGSLKPPSTPANTQMS